MKTHVLAVFLVIAIALFAGSSAVIIQGPGANLKSRDDNDPARVPYVFPPPGTDAVRNKALNPALFVYQHTDRRRNTRTASQRNAA